MPESVRAQIEKAAKGHGVSMNVEILNRIERTFREDRLEAIERRVALLETRYLYLLRQTPNETATPDAPVREGVANERK
jgi:hypothetical protein